MFSNPPLPLLHLGLALLFRSTFKTFPSTRLMKAVYGSGEKILVDTLHSENGYSWSIGLVHYAIPFNSFFPLNS